MKSILLLLALPLALLSQTSYKKKTRVLFIGNSYTYVNDLPQLVYNVALAAGDSMTYDSYTVGGYTFKNHFDDAQCLAKIAAQPWDVVVLQAQSQEPSFPDQQVVAYTYPWARKLDSVIKANHPCATTVFYETWGRKYGDQSNCANFPPLCTYSGMQTRLRKWYKTFADSCKGVMAPVGEAWRASITASPSLELYDPDQSHPVVTGSYLAACVFYETLFQRSVLSSTYNPGLPASTQQFLKQTAHGLMDTDSLSTWNIGRYLPWAAFTFSNSGANYQFTGLTGGQGHNWFFGDGATTQSATTQHLYAAAGTYTLSHVTTVGCKRDSVSQLLLVSLPTGIASSGQQPGLSLYPNPCVDYVYVQGQLPEGATFSVCDISGRLLRQEALRQNKIRLDGLDGGVYMVFIESNLGRFSARIVKNE